DEHALAGFTGDANDEVFTCHWAPPPQVGLWPHSAAAREATRLCWKWSHELTPSDAAGWGRLSLTLDVSLRVLHGAYLVGGISSAIVAISGAYICARRRRASAKMTSVGASRRPSPSSTGSRTDTPHPRSVVTDSAVRG